MVGSALAQPPIRYFLQARRTVLHAVMAKETSRTKSAERPREPCRAHAGPNSSPSAAHDAGPAARGRLSCAFRSSSARWDPDQARHGHRPTSGSRVPTESPPGSHASTQTSQLMGIPRPACTRSGVAAAEHRGGRLIARSSRLGSFARASPLRGRPRLRRFDRVASREMCSTRSIESASHASQDGATANSEKARENVASLGSGTAPAGRQSLPSPQDARQAARRRNVEHRLGYEGARQRRAVRPTWPRK